MDKKTKSTILLVAGFAVLMIAAAFLYGVLAPKIAPNNMQSASSGENTQTAQTVPDFTVYDKEGNEVQLSDYFGKPIVLNFWASWCGPCKMEMPEFNEMWEELEGNVQFLMVNVTDGQQETVDSASSYVESQGYTFPVFYDTTLQASLGYQAYSLPTTFFIDENGVGIAKATGSITKDQLQQGIEMIYNP